jgi:hypothetical protein
MAFVADIRAHAHPSSTPDSDTHYASNIQSSSSDFTDTTPVILPQENQHRPNPQPQSKNPSQSRYSQAQSATTAARSRTFSSASSTHSVISVRRKPLPASASPLATRYSTRFSSAEYFSPTTLKELPEPDLPFSRYTAVGDSPTLYEFPPSNEAPVAFSPDSSSIRSSTRSSVRSSKHHKPSSKYVY